MKTKAMRIAVAGVALGCLVPWLAMSQSYTDANATGAGPFFYRVGVTGP